MFDFNDEEDLILDSVREFSERIVEPRVQTDLENDVFPRDVLEQMREMGLPNVTLAEKWGGMGQSKVLHTAIEMEIAKINLTVALAGCSNGSATLLQRIGTPEQQQAFMPSLVKGGSGLGLFRL